MNGFITESVGKISDGFLNTIKLLVFFFFLKLLVIPIHNLFRQPGLIVYIFILLALAAYELRRSLALRTSDQKRIWRGMASGLYFWQAFLLITQTGSFPLFQQLGILFWVMVVLFTATLWTRVLPVGVRMGLLVLLTCWIGKIYFSGYSLIGSWSPFLTLGYESIRYIAAATGLAAILFIVYRSRDSVDRGYAAIVIFNALIYLLDAF